MQHLRFGQRAGKVNFPINANAWDLNLIYQIESDCIRREMEQTVGTNVTTMGLKGTLDYWATFKNNISSVYDTTIQCDTIIWNKAISGELQRESPSKKSINTMRVCFWVALLAEISVLLIQQAFTGDFNPFIIILAVILGLGGFLQGWGIGNLLFSYWKGNTGRLDSDSAFQHWLFIGIGSVLILLISVARGSGSFDSTQFFLIFFITFFFGEAVAVCEALSVKLSAQRDRCLQEMGQAQSKQASQTHHIDILKDNYKTNYETIANTAYITQQQMNPNPPK